MDLDLLARKLPAAGDHRAALRAAAGGSPVARSRRRRRSWTSAGAPGSTGWPPTGCSPTPLFFGGRSAGARVACRTAPDYPLAGVVCLAFPLHLPGRPEKSRATEAADPDRAPAGAAGHQGHVRHARRDPAAVAGDDPGVVLVELPGADHSYRHRQGRRVHPGRPASPPGRVGDRLHRVRRSVTTASRSRTKLTSEETAPQIVVHRSLLDPASALGRSSLSVVRVHARSPDSPQLRQLARPQAGVLTREQALAYGLAPSSLAPAGRGRHLAADQSRSVLRVRLARLLDRARPGPGCSSAVTSPGSAGSPPRICTGWSRSPPGDRRSASHPPAVRESTGPGASCVRATVGEIHARSGSPPRITIDDTVLDLVAESQDEAEVIGWVTGSRPEPTDPRRLSSERRCLDRVRRIPFRDALEAVIGDAAAGVAQSLGAPLCSATSSGHIGLPGWSAAGPAAADRVRRLVRGVRAARRARRPSRP